MMKTTLVIDKIVANAGLWGIVKAEYQPEDGVFQVSLVSDNPSVPPTFMALLEDPCRTSRP